jgi:hypothetical protein
MQQGCTSGPNGSCQFAASPAEVNVHEYKGRYYCQAHAPSRASFRFGVPELSQYVSRHQAEDINLWGVVFPLTGNPGFHPDFHLNASKSIDARNCTFDAGVVVHVQGVLDLTGSTCLGDFALEYAGNNLTAHEVRFGGDASITCTNAVRLDFTKSTVAGQFWLKNITETTEELRMDGMTLALAPKISLTRKSLPQDSSFRRLNLLKSAFGNSAEARYRAIRNFLHENRDREQEGLFYQYEKRAKRKGMSLWWPGNWVPRALSACYDWFAGYGQSYGRALVWFAIAQLGFALLYSVMSGRFALGGRPDSKVLAFTFSQVVKPFELLSARTADGGVYQGLNIDGNGWWIFATALDSLFSLTLVALFFLALRWRFRRD